MKKAYKQKLQEVIDQLDLQRAAIRRVQENEDPEDGNIEYLEAAIDQITEAIGNIEWTV